MPQRRCNLQHESNTSHNNHPIIMRFQRSIAGFNLGKEGITSYSRSLRLGKIANLNFNISKDGLSLTASLPGTGLSTGAVRLLDLRPAPKRWATRRRRIERDLDA